MRITWEETDIHSGVKYSREGIGETWMIIKSPANELNYMSVSLVDGCIGGVPLDRKELAAQLTECQYLPIFVMDGLGLKP